MSYVIAQPAGLKSPQLFVTRRTGSGLLGVVPDRTRYTGEGTTYRLSAEEIIVPLGDDPPYGSAYGALVEPIRDRWMVHGWGTVYSYVQCTPDTRDRVQRALVKSRRLIERHRPGSIYAGLVTELRNPRGKNAGTYAYRPKGDDELMLRITPGTGLRELVKTCTHELGHGIWSRAMTPEQRARWILEFGRYVTVETVEPARVRRALKGIRQIASVRDYLRECEPEDVQRLEIFVHWLQKVHGIGKSEMQDMVSAGEEIPVPDVHLHRSDVDTPVTLYSRSSPVEMYCEALSSLMVGDLSDRRLTRLLESGAR